MAYRSATTDAGGAQTRYTKRRGSRHGGTRTVLTTNYLLRKGDQWPTLILAVRRILGLQSSQTFVRSFRPRNLAKLEEVGIFDQLMMKIFNRKLLKASPRSEMVNCSEACGASRNATGSASRSRWASKRLNHTGTPVRLLRFAQSLRRVTDTQKVKPIGRRLRRYTRVGSLILICVDQRSSAAALGQIVTRNSCTL